MTNPPQGSDQPGGEGSPAPSQQPSGQSSQPTTPLWTPAYGQPAPQQQPHAPPPGHYGAGPYGAPTQGQSPYGQAPYGPAPYGHAGGQPSDGAPGQLYGPPFATPARKSHVGLIIGVTAGVVAVIAVAAVLALTLGGTVLDKSAVERDVAKQFEQREGVALDLRCADDMKVTKGSHYECRGTTADGEHVTLRITITDEQNPAYTWTEP